MNLRAAVGFATFALLLVATSDVRTVGDGHEYVAMAVATVTFGSPSPTQAQLDELEDRLAVHSVPVLEDAVHQGSDGRLHFRHFWMYSVIAAPAVGLAMLVGAHPAAGFTLLNVVLLSLAAGLLAQRAGIVLTSLLFAGPIIWWIDKAHPEPFVFALMIGGFALLDSRPGPALVVWGLAAAQYPPLALLPALGAFGVLWQEPERRHDRSFLAAATAALTLVALHPLLSLWRLGVVSPLVFWGRAPGIPSWRAWSAVYTDLNVGLLVNFPLLPIVTGTLLFRLPRTPSREPATRVGVVLALVAAVVLPFAFAQTTNVNHGGTPSMSRYALWLIPLAVPLLIAVGTGARESRRWLTAAVAASVVWCLALYHPGRPERYEEPTRMATLVWRHAPRWSTPLPEIFAERLTHRAPGLLPIATPSCSKVLLREGRWPAPCSPAASVPGACREADALCYANRRVARPGGYRFRVIDEPVPRAHVWNRTVWPRAIEQRVAALLAELRWWEMVPTPRQPPDAVLRAARRVGWTTTLQGDGRFFLYASRPREGNTVMLRLPEPMSGELIAMANGVVIRSVESPPLAGAPWTLSLPPTGEPGVALVLGADRAPMPRP